jgi:hypothetical protein
MKTISVLITTMVMVVSVKAQENNIANSFSAPIEIVKEFLSAYTAGDHEKFASLLHPDVIWVQPGENRISGVKKSKVELLQMGAKMWEFSAQTIRLTDVKYFDGPGNTVVCLLHWKAAQPTGNLLDIDNVDVYTVEDGKITHAKIYSENIEEENKFWGK